MADKVFMQVVQKSTNYGEGKSRLDLFETDIKDIVRNIKDAATPTLSTVATEDFISTGLLGDIKTKQEEFTTTSSDFDDYIADIQALADTDPRADLTPYTTWTYTYSAIVAADIAAGEPVTYEILRQIMNNEGYFHERRINIMLMLVYLRDFAIDTQMLGLWEIYPSQYAVLDAIADADLILEDLTDAQIGGDNTMLLKQKELDLTQARPPGTYYKYITIDSDEILHSIDSIDIDIYNAYINVEIYDYNVGTSNTKQYYAASTDSWTGPATNYKECFLNILNTSDTTDNGSGTFINNFSPETRIRVKIVIDDVHDISYTSGTLYYTTRKIISYT